MEVFDLSKSKVFFTDFRTHIGVSQGAKLPPSQSGAKHQTAKPLVSRLRRSACPGTPPSSALH